MNRFMLKSKIHRATVTDANLEYEGSITIDENLMDAGDLIEFEKVAIFDVTNGNRIETYVIRGERGTGVMCVNGAAAHQIRQGDIIIVASFVTMDEAETARHQPRLVYVDSANRIRKDSKLAVVH